MTAAQQALAEVLAITARLRGPGGCPWDAAQSFASIAPYTIEEAYEVAGAAEAGDMAALKTELGDLLLQVVFHAQMAEEAGSFSFADVAQGLAEKLVRRHPHVFGEASAHSADEVAGIWEAAKAAERPERSSLVADIETALPALTRAAKMQARVARVGFDWPIVAGSFAKLREELAELEAELPGGNADRLADEYGDVLFVVANIGRKIGADPEQALRRATAKFARRFAHIEAALGPRLGEADLAEMEVHWRAAKAAGL